jgi:hypothetical protein
MDTQDSIQAGQVWQHREGWQVTIHHTTPVFVFYTRDGDPRTRRARAANFLAGFRLAAEPTHSSITLRVEFDRALSAQAAHDAAALLATNVSDYSRTAADDGGSWGYGVASAQRVEAWPTREG